MRGNSHEHDARRAQHDPRAVAIEGLPVINACFAFAGAAGKAQAGEVDAGAVVHDAGPSAVGTGVKLSKVTHPVFPSNQTTAVCPLNTSAGQRVLNRCGAASG